MQIAVFGASGWVGRAVSLQLAGRHAVVTVGRPGSPSQLHVDPYSRGDVAKLLEDQSVSVVVNAQGAVGRDIDQLVQANVLATTALLHATTTVGARLVHIGSAAEVAGELVDGRGVPLDPYGWSKAMASSAVLGAAAEGADVVIARVHSVVAPGMKHGTVVEVHRRVAQARSKLDLSDLGSTRDYVSLDFVGRAVRLLAEAQVSGVVDVCSGAGTTPTMLAEAFMGLLDRRLDLLRGPIAVPVTGDPRRLSALGIAEHLSPAQLAQFVVDPTLTPRAS